MHDEVRWLATDPRDLEPDGWSVDDYFRFSWACSAHHLPTTDRDGALMKQYMLELDTVNSALSCWRFNNRWAST